MTTEDFGFAAYQEHLAQGKLMASRCRDCAGMYLPPRPICPVCHTRNMTWAELQGEGTIVGFTAIAIVPANMAAKGFGRDNPYATAVISLAEGPGITARVEAAEGEGPGVYVGMPVKASFVEEASGDQVVSIPVFRPI